MRCEELIAPASTGTRDLVRAWLESVLEPTLEDTLIAVDCSDLRSVTPSFVDEIMKIVLIERQASRLSFINPTERAKSYVSRSAQNRGVTDRVDVVAPPPRSAHRVRHWWASPAAAAR